MSSTANINAAVWLQAELPASQVPLLWTICPLVLLTAMAVFHAPAFCEGNTVARTMQYNEWLLTSWSDTHWTFFESNSLYPLSNSFVAVTCSCPVYQWISIGECVWGWVEVVQLHLHLSTLVLTLMLHDTHQVLSHHFLHSLLQVNQARTWLLLQPYE